MKPFRTLAAVSMLIGLSFALGYGLRGFAASNSGPTSAPPSGDAASQAAAEKLPNDVYPDSRNRLPNVKREELDAEAQKLYDNATKGVKSAAGLRGPSGLRLQNPRLAVLMEPSAEYIRFDTKLGPQLTQIAMLVTARETDCMFEWTGHEVQAQQAGVPQSLIDIIKYRKPLAGVGETEAALIQLGREDFEKHQVAPDTFARALKALGKENLISALAVMGHQADTAILLTAFDQHLAPGQKSLLPMP